MSPFFRFSFLLELPRPADHPDKGDCGIALEEPQDQTQRKIVKKGIREHPRFSLRIAALIALTLGIVLNTVIYSTYGRHYYTVRQLSGVADVMIIVFLAYHLSDLYAPRSLPAWLLGIVETLGFLIFGILFGFNCAAIDQMLGPYYQSEAAVLLAYNSGLWVVSLIVHAIIIAQCITHRSRPCQFCPNCKHHASPSPAEANRKNATDEEAALLSTEPAPEGSLQQYRDEEVEDSRTHS